MIPYGGWLSDHLPSGRYPALILAMPVLVMAVILFAIGAFVLKRLGLPAWKSSQENPGQPSKESEKENGLS
jgi:hypothetical protein